VKFIRKDKLSMPDIAVPVPVVINATLAKKHATASDPWAMEWLKSNDAGGGAYKLGAWKPGSETVYERFDDWKSGPLPKLRRCASTRRFVSAIPWISAISWAPGMPFIGPARLAISCKGRSMKSNRCAGMPTL